MGERHGRFVEWTDGTVIAMPQPTIQELQVRWFLRTVFEVYLEQSGGGRAMGDPFTMKTGVDLPARQPDVFVILPERLHMLHEREFAGAAHLVIEITTAGYEERDTYEKFHEYEQGGVDEYWILDLQRREPLFYVRGEDGLFHARPPIDGVYTSHVLPKLHIPVNLLWQEKLPEVIEIVQMVENMLKEQP